MKKKLLALLLVALMVVSLVPMTVFAAGTSYAITNGTPENAKETNHGYITIDKATAAEGETVTITVNPADGYQLKSLTVTPEAPATKTIADVLATAENDFPKMADELDEPADGWWEATGEGWTKECYLTLDDNYLRFYFNKDCKDISKNASVSQDSDNYVYTDGTVTITFNMTGGVLSSIEFADTATDTWDGEYFPQSQCIAAGTMISMPGGRQKAVEELEIGDVICTFDHETGEVSSAPVAFIWESKNVGNAFTLTFEGDVEVTVIEEHGFYDQEEQKYVFINLQNAEEYIGHRFYNADTNSWSALKTCEALNDSVDAYAIITSGHLNHMSNGMLSMCDGSVKVFANIFEYDDQMKYDADKKKADIEAYGLTPKEKILELKGFTETDYDTYNLQYVDIMIGKGLITWEWLEALSDYCVENGLVDVYSGSETAEENEAPKMLLMSVTAPKKLLGSALEPTPQDGIKVTANEDGTYTFTMPAYAVTVTAEFEAIPCTATFDVGNVGTAPQSQTVAYGAKLTEPADPAADGWTFGGWYTDDAFTTAWDFETDTVTKDITLFAKWTENVPETYTVTFNMNGHGTQITAQTVESGSKASKPADPTADGWTFGGWYADDAFTTAWDFETDTVTKDITLFAKWTEVPAEPETEVTGGVIPAEDVSGLEEYVYSLEDDTTRVTLNVVEQTETEVEATAAEAIQAKMTANQKAEYMDISIYTTNSIGDVYAVHDTTTIITLKISYDFANKTNVAVIRYHGGAAEAEKMTKNPAAGAEGYEIDEAARTITIFASKFSTYAIVYEDAQPDPDPAPILPTAYLVVGPATTENGRLTISKKEAYADEKVTLTAKPDEGYELDFITATDKNGKEIALTDLGNGKFSFTMPASKVTVAVGFKAIEAEEPIEEPETKPCPKDDTCPIAKFDDTTVDFWWHDGIHYCLENGLMKGVSDSEFNPTGTTSRAMIVTILYRLEGEPAFMNDNIFSDVASGSWYEKAVVWASGKGIVLGYDDGSFQPDKAITREELAAILYRYAQMKGEGFVGASMFLMPFDDLMEISDWASESVRWCYMHHIILGRTETTFVPKATATRAEAATMIQRFCESLGK